MPNTCSTSVAKLRRPDCREKTLDLLLQALGLLCEFTGRTENQFGGSSHLARCLRHAGNVLQNSLRALRGLLHAAGNFLGRSTLLLHRGGDRCGDLADLPDGGAECAKLPARCPGCVAGRLDLTGD